MTTPSLKQLVRNPDHFFAFGFGTGLSPWAPGTMGTLAAIPIYWLIQDVSWPIYLSWLLVTFILGVYWCGRSSRALGVHDHGGIVWDEFVGYWVTMFMAPKGWIWILLGFVLFRFFDIVKPWPIRWLDRRVKGGFGIMVDDLLAGILAGISLQIIACLGLFA
ncbi:phosphatidylglycerophosphatase A family protein [Cellvibrio japonicus]|uniref:Phosphatidylglycerophosphatase A n=1 Tax=Cellvibrio japonicus (strain Ueda107) TaxID=498211 RepID=B3PBC4_CELJU|nr:phosphatidylglycerophosphatase A [Cellvibrio japonicus]ACE84784.1 Phosphatidylglycerophosphatase A [Cellvibrio japonicus Ueda107]QEI13051.1 phosphatidylglycerophosphatase A [Cellvibrio japonicus]QEI16625.1 phosphatidylglycerophosphatase A [Cellvibrio japonicus]QEI20203.1 phosphatidylglycerophosphatase A [Cellvibrio japonicus]